MKRKSTGQKTTQTLSKRDREMIKYHVEGMPLRQAALKAGYNERMASSVIYRRFKEPPAQEYYKLLQAQIIQDASLSCKWFLERCMKVFDSCSELIDDGKGGLRVRDALGAAKMASIIKDAIPDFKERHEHTITEVQTIVIGGQEITF